MVATLIETGYIPDYRNINPETYFNYTARPNVFSDIDKNSDNQFPLKLVRKQKCTHDSYMLEF